MEAVIIIPVYQPEPVLEQLVDELWQYGNFIVIVDDGSSEESQQVFWRLSEKAIVLHHAENKGKGAAIKTGLAYIKNDLYEYDIVGVMDGDGQHLSQDMEKMIFRARTNRDAMILGVRQIGKKMPFRSKIGNTITKKIFRLASGAYVSDTQSGLRAFSREKIDAFLNVSGNRYEYETAILFYCVKKRIPIIEVPIETIYINPENSTSHFKVVLDSVRIYRELLKFSLSSASSFCLDYFLFSIFVIFLGKTKLTVLVANICARVISAVYNFLMNTHFVFHEKPTYKTIVEYAGLAFGILFLNNIFLNNYINLLAINVFAAKILTEITLFILSFIVQKIWIFKRKKSRVL